MAPKKKTTSAAAKKKADSAKAAAKVEKPVQEQVAPAAPVQAEIPVQ